MNVSFSVAPECILRENPSYPGGQWLPGANVNPAKNCLNLKRNRTLDDIAVLWRDEGDDELPLQKMTLKELRSRVWYGVFDSLYKFVSVLVSSEYSINVLAFPWVFSFLKIGVDNIFEKPEFIFDIGHAVFSLIVILSWKDV